MLATWAICKAEMATILFGILLCSLVDCIGQEQHRKLQIVIHIVETTVRGKLAEKFHAVAQAVYFVVRG